MPRPVRELWKALGARSDDDGGDLLVVDAKVLALESLFGGALAGEATVRLFSEEAFGFSAPDELAALGVFWAPHLEKDEQLRAAVKDAQDRLQRRLDEEGRMLARLGFRAELEPPIAQSRGQVTVDGHVLDVVIGGGGELLLERVDGAAVPADAQEIVHVVETAKRDEVQHEIAARARTLIAGGLGTPAELSMEEILDDGGGFDDDSATRQLPAAAAEDLDPGTELVPPSGEGDVDGDLSDAERDELARALAEEELASDSDEEAALGFDDDSDGGVVTPRGTKAPASRAQARASEEEDEGDDDFMRPTTSPSVASKTLAPGSFVDFPAMATEQISVVPPQPSEDSAGGFDEDTGEQGLLGSLSGEDSIMPSPAEATALRPAPTASQLGLSDEDDAPLAAPPASAGGDEEEERTMTVAAVALSDGDDVDDSPRGENDDDLAADEEEHTVARAQQFSTGRKGPSLVSSGNAGSSADEPHDRDDVAVAPAEAAGDLRQPALADSVEEANTLRPGQLSRTRATAAAEHPPLSDDDEYERTEHESQAQRGSSSGAPSADSLGLEVTDPVLAVIERRAPDSGNQRDEGAGPSLEVDIEVAVPSDEPGDRPIDKAGMRRASATARAEPVKTPREDPTAAEPPHVEHSEERIDALAAIVGEGMSSGKTGAIMLDADAFAHLRALTGHDLPLSEDPDALEREAELLESKARELRGRAEMLRQRPTVPVSARKLASRLERERAGRDHDDASALEGAVASSDASAFDDSAAFSSQDAFTARDPMRPFGEDADGEDQDAADKDAFADGVALEEVRAMLAAERVQPAPEGYAATQLAEMDLGDLPQPSHSGDVFGGGDDEEAPYDTGDNTSRASAYQTSMGSLPQVASSDVHALGSLAERPGEGASDPALADGNDDDGLDTLSLAAAELRAVSANGVRALALVVNDPRARERLKKHLEETFPRVVELASAHEAATLSARDVQAVVIVRPIHDEATVSGLAALSGNGGRPPVLVLSSDVSFDGMPGVDLRLELGRRASEVARQVLEGLTTLGVQASA